MQVVRMRCRHLAVVLRVHEVVVGELEASRPPRQHLAGPHLEVAARPLQVPHQPPLVSEVVERVGDEHDVGGEPTRRFV
ncbi:MAG: hypothetical protein ACRDJ4_00620 [Actinomycetota bacterium]